MLMLHCYCTVPYVTGSFLPKSPKYLAKDGTVLPYLEKYFVVFRVCSKDL
jgi:hypothetical protein